MKHNYTALDSAILEAIKSGPKKFRELETAPEIKRQSIKIAAAHNASIEGNGWPKEAWRFIDTRLQALRKKGQIEFIDQARGWALCSDK